MELRWADVPSHLLPLAWGISVRHFIAKSIRSNESSSRRQQRLKKKGGGEERVESGDEGMGRRGDGIHSMKKWGVLASRMELGPSVWMPGVRQERAKPLCVSREWSDVRLW
jgi:hypothetical protein